MVLDLISMEFSFINRLGRNCIILGADMSSSSHANNKKKIFLSLKNCIQLILLKKMKNFV